MKSKGNEATKLSPVVRELPPQIDKNFNGARIVAMVEEAEVTPKLRFPEFLDAAEWNKTKLADILTEHKLKNNGKCEVHSVSVHKGIINQIEHLGRSFAASDTSNYNIVRPNDIVYTRSPTGDFPFGIIKQNHNGYNVIVSPLYGVFTPDNRNIGYIIEAYFESHVRTNNYLSPITQKGAKNTIQISNETFLSKGFYLPDDELEQQKIAECLSSLDELITVHTQKLDKLKEHKKGLMQQLFPAEGEMVPKLRFPEFRDAGKWGKVALGEIADIKLGKMLDSKKHTTGNLLPYLNNLSVRWNHVNTSNLPKMYFDDDERVRFGLRAGDVVVCEGGEPGRSAVWDGRLPDIKFQKAIHRVRFNIPFEPHLLVFYLESIAGTPLFEMLFTGGGIKHLTQETFSQLNIPLISHSEQQKITHCLLSFSEQITKQTQKIEVLKAHKKGLMQQLFPVLGGEK